MEENQSKSKEKPKEAIEEEQKPEEQAKDIKKPEEKETAAIPAETPTEPNLADVINDLYTQINALAELINRINKELETIKLNQLWIQQYTTNVLKSTEVKE